MKFVVTVAPPGLTNASISRLPSVIGVVSNASGKALARPFTVPITA
jgi:hypothetical protein